MFFRTHKKQALLGVLALLLLTAVLAWFGRGTPLWSNIITGGISKLMISAEGADNVLLGEEISVVVSVYSTEALSKVASALYYDPKGLKFLGHEMSGSSFLGLELRKVNEEMGWIYIADGTKDIRPTGGSIPFVTLKFRALRAGVWPVKLDWETSKLHFTQNHVPFYFKDVPDVQVDIGIREPEIVVERVGGDVVVGEKVKVKYTIADMGKSSVKRVKIKPLGDATIWDRIQGVVYDGQDEQEIVVGTADGEKSFEFWFQDQYGSYYPSEGPIKLTWTKDSQAISVAPFVLVEQYAEGGVMKWKEVRHTKSATPTFAWRTSWQPAESIKAWTLEIIKKGEMTSVAKRTWQIADTLQESADSTYRRQMKIEEALADGEYLPVVTVESVDGTLVKKEGYPFLIDTRPPVLGAQPLLYLTKDTKEIPQFLYKDISDMGSGVERMSLVLKQKAGDKTYTMDLLMRAVEPNTLFAFNRPVTSGEYDAFVTVSDAVGNTISEKKVLSFHTIFPSAEAEVALRARISELEQQYQALLSSRSSSGGGGGGGGGGIFYTGPVRTLAQEEERVALLRRELELLKGQPSTQSTPVSSVVEKSPEKTVGRTRIFPDLPHGHWAQNAVDTLVSRGVLNGYADGTLRPNTPITRAEFLKLVLTARDGTVVNTSTTVFRDVPVGTWFAPYVQSAYSRGIVAGNGRGEFFPHQPITRAEATKILLGTFALAPTAYKNVFTDVVVEDWFAPYVQTAYDKKIIQGYLNKTFQPQRSLSRAEASVLLAPFLKS